MRRNSMRETGLSICRWRSECGSPTSQMAVPRGQSRGQEGALAALSTVLPHVHRLASSINNALCPSNVHKPPSMLRDPVHALPPSSIARSLCGQAHRAARLQSPQDAKKAKQDL